MSNNILIIYASVGTGHETAAEAISQAFRHKKFKTFKVDLLKQTKSIFIQALPEINEFLRYIYKNYNNSIGLIIQKTWKKNKKYGKISAYYQDFFTDLCIEDTINLIKKIKPIVIICTHPLPANVISKIKSNNKVSNIRLYTIATDHEAHGYWPKTNVDTYFVPNANYRKQLINDKYDKSKILISGIPLRKEFLKTDKNNKDRITIFLGGGENTPVDSKNIIYTKILINYILANKLNAKIELICGKNELLYEYFKNLYANQIKLHKYIKNPGKLIHKSKIIVSKPGGLITAEAIYAQCYFISMQADGWQENENLSFLLKNKCGILLDINNLEQVIKVYNHKLLPNKKSTFASNIILSNIMIQIK